MLVGQSLVLYWRSHPQRVTTTNGIVAGLHSRRIVQLFGIPHIVAVGYDSILGPDAFEEIIRWFARRVSLRSLRETINGYEPRLVDLYNLALCDAWHVVFSMRHVRLLAR